MLTVVEGFQILASVATAAAAWFAWLTVRESRRERIKSDKPIFQFKTGEYVEAALPLDETNINDKKIMNNPNNRMDNIVHNVGGGTAIILQVQGYATVGGPEEELPRYKLNIYGDNAIFANEALSSKVFVSELNKWLGYHIDDKSKEMVLKDERPSIRLDLTFVYTDISGIAYAQKIRMSLSVELYELLYTNDRFLNPSLIDLTNIPIEGSRTRIRVASFFYGVSSLQQEISRLPRFHRLRHVTWLYKTDMLKPDFGPAPRLTPLRQAALLRERLFKR